MEFKSQVLTGVSLWFQVNRPLTMKKEGIQTRNRKLSSKTKKKKSPGSVISLPDCLKPLSDKSFPSFSPAGQFSMGMNHYMNHQGAQFPVSMGGSFVSSSPISQHMASTASLSSQISQTISSSMSGAQNAALNLGSGAGSVALNAMVGGGSAALNSMVGAMA